MENTFNYGDLGELLQQAVGQPLKYYTVFTSGNCANSYLVNGTHVVKIPFEKRTALMLQRELSVSKVLKGYNLPYQTPIWREYRPVRPYADVYGNPIKFCAVRKIINGRTPSDLANPELMADLGLFFAKLHKIPAVRFNDIPTMLDLNFEQDVNMLENYASEKAGLSDKELVQIRQLLSSTILSEVKYTYFKQVRPVLCHHDLHKNNVLVNDEGRLIAVLDFGAARLAPAKTDINLLKMTLSDDNFNAFMKPYQKYAKGVNVADTQKYEKALIFRLSSVVSERYFSLVKSYVRE